MACKRCRSLRSIDVMMQTFFCLPGFDVKNTPFLVGYGPNNKRVTSTEEWIERMVCGRGGGCLRT